MGTWQENRCPKCCGRLFIDNDMDGWYEQCINCSYRNELKEAVGLARVANTKAAHYKKPDYRRTGDL